MSDTVYKMQQRVSQYSTEAQAYQEGSNRITIEIPGVYRCKCDPGRTWKTRFSVFHRSDRCMTETRTLQQETVESGYVLARSIEDIQKAGSVVLEGTDVADAEGGAISGFIHKLPEICSQSDSYKGWKNQICGSYQGKCWQSRSQSYMTIRF